MCYRFAYRPYRRTLPVPLRTAHGAWSEREGIFVRLESENGGVGFGEIAPIRWFGTETMAEALAVCANLGADCDDALLDAVPMNLACVRFGLEAARSAAKASEQARASEPAPGGAVTRLPVATLLPAGRAALALLPARLEEGFLAAKWKVGVERAEEEIPLLDDLLGLLPSYFKLRLDANGAWDRRTAEKWLAHCADRPVEFVEQPVPAEEIDLTLGLAEDYPTTLALDEAVTGLAAARQWQERGWRGVFVIKPALAGPLGELQAWAAATKPDLVISSAIESALARAQLLHATFSLGLTKRALGVGVGGVFGDRRWDGPATGPLVDVAWAEQVNAEELWNAAS